jgi:hypothetical protein
MIVGDHYKGFCFDYMKKENYSTFLNNIPTGT